MNVIIYDVEHLPFGSKVRIKMFDGTMENGVVIIGAIAFKDGKIIEFKDITSMTVYMDWT